MFMEDVHGGSSRKTDTEGGLPKKGGLEQFAVLRGAWQEKKKKGGGVILRCTL